MIDEGDINPYLSISLDMRIIEEVVDFFLIERSNAALEQVLEPFLKNL